MSIEIADRVLAASSPLPPGGSPTRTTPQRTRAQAGRALASALARAPAARITPRLEVRPRECLLRAARAAATALLHAELTCACGLVRPRPPAPAAPPVAAPPGPPSASAGCAAAGAGQAPRRLSSESQGRG